MIIAVDFDGTLCKDCYPEIGEPNKPLIQELKQRIADGDQLILWTCRSGKLLNEATTWCGRFGLIFAAVNDNVPETIHRYGHNSRKITADIYVDDRSLRPDADMIFRKYSLDS